MSVNVSRISAAIKRCVKWSDRASRYDLILAVIPTAFVFAGVLHLSTSLSPTTAILAASLLGSVAVIDALFMNPPRGPSTKGTPA